MYFEHKNESLKIERYPVTTNKSLRAWSAVEEHMLLKSEDLNLEEKKIAIYNDRFGFMSIFLRNYNVRAIIADKSQCKSFNNNFETNKIDVNKIERSNLMSENSWDANFGFIHVPKSLKLFRLMLIELAENSSDDLEIVCGFMTKYFSNSIIEIANEYFEDVTQSKAFKKSRLLHLKKKRSNYSTENVSKITFNNEVIQQYYGVFSSNKIDYATQFLIKKMVVNPDVEKVLDLASGNGILAKYAKNIKPNAEVHLIDDSYLAIESSKLNLVGLDNIHYHFNDDLKDLENNYFDLVLSNPPFHFEHENNIEISLSLFKSVSWCLKPGGSFQLVANKHLNYKTHLIKMFNKVDVLAENEKFIIYNCIK